MQAVATETFYPADQYQSDVKDEKGEKVLKTGATGYRIKALTSLQFTEVMSDGFENRNGQFVMGFKGIMLLLRHGLEDPAKIGEMKSIHHREVAQAIYEKAALDEAQRKN